MDSLRIMAIENIKKGNLTMEYAKKMIESNEKNIKYWKHHFLSAAAKIKIREAKTFIEYFEIVIEILSNSSDKV